MSSKHDLKDDKNGASNFVDVKGLSRDRPWLLPSVGYVTGRLTPPPHLHVFG